MAEKLQKQLNVQPTVASLGNPVGPDTTTAEAIGAAGNLATTFVAESKSAKLKDGLRELGDEVFAIRSGKQLEKTTDRFKALMQAKEQGNMTDTFVNIQAEKVLKEAIGNMPGFAPELRAEAASILGFDPTGSEIGALFGKTGRSSGPKGPKSLLDKWKEEAQAVSAATNGQFSETDALANIGKAHALRSKTAAAKLMLEADTINSHAFLQFHMEESQTYIMDSLVTIQQKIAQGGVVDVESMLSDITAQKTLGFDRYKSELFESGKIVSPADMSAARKTYNENFSGIEDMIKTGDMAKILERNAGSLASAAKIEGFNAFPVIATLNSVGGAPLVETWLNVLTSKTSAEQLKFIAKIDPAVGLLMSDPKGRADQITASFARAQGFPVPAGMPEPNPLVLDTVTANILNSDADPEVKNNTVRALREQNTPFKELSIYAQQGVRERATPEMVENVKVRWAKEQPALMGRIAAELERNEGKFEVRLEGGKFKVWANPERFGTLRGTKGVPSTPIPNSPSFALTADVKRLNTSGDLVRNGWATDVGAEKAGFMERTINQLDGLRAKGGDVEESNKAAEAMAAWQADKSDANFERLQRDAPEVLRRVQARRQADAAAAGKANE